MVWITGGQLTNNWEERFDEQLMRKIWEGEKFRYFMTPNDKKVKQFIRQELKEARIDVLTEIKKEYNEWDCPDEEAMSVCENGSCLDCYLNQRINKSLKEMK